METGKKRRAKKIIFGGTSIAMILIFFGIGNWVKDNRSIFLDPIWEERPDIGMALYWVDTITPIGEKDWLAEIGVWYLTRSEYPLLYDRLDGRLLRNCGRGGLFGKLGPQDYALRILGAKGNQRSIDILYYIATKPSVDGVDHCRPQGKQGLALMGEDVVPMMVQITTDMSRGKYERGFAVEWLSDMGSGDTKFTCLEELGCEPFDSDWGKQWGDLYYYLAINDPEFPVRAQATRALIVIGDPRAEEAVRFGLETETDPRHLLSYELMVDDLNLQE